MMTLHVSGKIDRPLMHVLVGNHFSSHHLRWKEASFLFPSVYLALTVFFAVNSSLKWGKSNKKRKQIFRMLEANQ